MEELKTGLFDLGGGTLYDADEDIFINSPLHGGNIGGVYKNPLDKARDEERKAEKNKKWLITKGPEEMAKLLKERETLDKIIGRLNNELVENGQIYRDNYDYAIEALANYQPAIKAAKKFHYEPMIKKSIGESVSNIYTRHISNNLGAQYKHVINPFNIVPRIEGPIHNEPRHNLIEDTKIVTDPETGTQMIRVNKNREEPIYLTLKEYQDSINPKITQPFKIKGKTTDRKKSELLGIKKIGSTSNIPIKTLKTRNPSKSKVEQIKTPKPKFVQGKLKFNDDFEEDEDPFNQPQPNQTVIVIPESKKEDIEDQIKKLKEKNEVRKMYYSTNKKLYDKYIDRQKKLQQQYDAQYAVAENEKRAFTPYEKGRLTTYKRQFAEIEKSINATQPVMTDIYNKIIEVDNEIQALEAQLEGEGLYGNGYIRSVQELLRRKKLYKRKV